MWPAANLLPGAAMTYYGRQIPAEWRKRIGITPLVYRLLAFTIAAAQMLAFSSDGYSLIPPTILVSVVGIYTLFKVMWPLRQYQGSPPGHVLLGVDIAICIFLVLSTGGIYSPFLLYTLSPVLTAALFLSGRVTFSVAGISIAYVIGSHLANPFFATRLSISELSYFMVYMIAVSLAAVLPYVINANLKQRLQAESMLSERQRISREIHDGFAQTLTMLRWRVQLLQRHLAGSRVGLGELRELEKLAKKAQYDAREALELLHDSSQNGRLLPRLKDYLKRLKQDTSINVSLDTGAGEVRLDTAVEIELLRICQEALTNVRKHSDANNVHIKLKVVNGHLLVTITDDGCGFDAAAGHRDSPAGGYGLAVMQERAELIGGTFQVISTPGKGTEVQVEVPRNLHRGEVLWQKNKGPGR